MSSVSALPQEQGEYRVGNKRPPLHTRFKKGQSGNPGGIPKGTPKISTALQMRLAGKIGKSLKAYTPAEQIAAKLVEFLQENDPSAEGWLQALKETIDRTEGKAKETKDITSTVKIQVVFDEQPGEDNPSQAPAPALGPAADSIEFETVQCAGVWETVR